MRRRLALAVTLLILLGGFDSATAATVIKPGGTCPKAGVIQSSGGKSYVCAKKGTKLTWMLLSTPSPAKPTAPLPSTAPTAAPTPTPSQAPMPVLPQAPVIPTVSASLSYLETVVGEPLFTLVGTPGDLCQISTPQTSGTGVKQAITLDDSGKYQFTLTKAGLGTSATVQASCTKSGEARSAYEAPKPTVKAVTINSFPATAVPGQVVKYQIIGTPDDECTQQFMFPGSPATSKSISLGKSGTLDSTLTIGSTTGLVQIEVKCTKSGSIGVSSQVDYAIVKATIGGIPEQMAPLEKFTWTLKATPNDTCELSTTFPGQSATTQTITLKSGGTASTAVTLGSRTGQLVYSITCAKSGSATAVSNVTSATASTPTTTTPTPTTPAPTTSTTGRLTSLCIKVDAGAPFKGSCQSDPFLGWSLDLCTPKSTNNWSLFYYSRDGKLIPTITLFNLPMSRIMSDSGLDLPSRCPDSANPMYIIFGDTIPRTTTKAETFYYAARRTYKNSYGVTSTQDYLITVEVS